MARTASGLRGDDRLVADGLVALVFGDGVHGAGKLDDAVGGGGPPATIGRPFMNESRTTSCAAARSRAQRGERVEIGRDQLGEALAALDRAGRLRDQADLLDDALAGEVVGDLHEGDEAAPAPRAFPSDRSPRRRARAKGRAEQAFRRQLPHVADVGLLGGGLRRKMLVCRSRRRAARDRARRGSPSRIRPPTRSAGIPDRHRAAGGVAHRHTVAGCRCCRKHTQARNSDEMRMIPACERHLRAFTSSGSVCSARSGQVDVSTVPDRDLARLDKEFATVHAIFNHRNAALACR